MSQESQASELRVIKKLSPSRGQLMFICIGARGYHHQTHHGRIYLLFIDARGLRPSRNKFWKEFVIYANIERYLNVRSLSGDIFFVSFFY